MLDGYYFFSSDDVRTFGTLRVERRLMVMDADGECLAMTARSRIFHLGPSSIFDSWNEYNKRLFGTPILLSTKQMAIA